MAKARRKRRTTTEVLAVAMQLAEKGAFTPHDLATKVGFGTGRARQVLEGMTGKKLVVLGKRRSPRGKPAVLWGLPGTKLKRSDTEPRGKPAGGTREQKTEGSRETGPSLGAALGSFFGELVSKGLEITGPAGITFRVRIGGEAEEAPVKIRKRRTVARLKPTRRAMKKPRTKGSEQKVPATVRVKSKPANALARASKSKPRKPERPTPATTAVAAATPEVPSALPPLP